MSQARPALFSWQRIAWRLVLIAVCLYQGYQVGSQLRPRRLPGGQHVILDFVQEWASARNYLDGLPVYWSQEESYRHHLNYRRSPNEFFLERNAHPPTSVLLVLPLARLDYPDAFLAWNLLSLAALVVSGRIIVRQLGITLDVWMLLGVLALVLVCNPFTQQVHQGQLNLILLLLLTGTWAADRSGWPLLAGVCLGTATALKLFPAFLFLYFLLRRRWTVLASGVLTVVVLTALSAAVLGVETYESYVKEVMPVVTAYRDWWPNVSLFGFWAKLFDGRSGKTIPVVARPILAQALGLASCAGLVAVLTPAVLRARSQYERDVAFGLTLTANLLVSPITWDHYFTLLFLPLTVLWTRLPVAGLGRTAFWVIVLFLWLSPFVYWKLIPGVTMENWQSMTATPIQTMTALSVQTYALLALLAMQLAVLRRRAADPTVDGSEAGLAAG